MSPKSALFYRIFLTSNRILCVLYIALYWFFDITNSYFFSIIIIGTTLLRIFFSPRVSSLAYVFYIVIVYLYAIPSVGMLVDGEKDPLIFLCITVLGLDAFVRLSDKRNVISLNRVDRTRPSDMLIWLSMIVLSSVGALVVPGGQFAGLFAFVVPFSISLLYFERILPSLSNRKIYMFFLVYLIVVGIYISYYWSGFGRIVIGGFVLMPVLIADRYRDFGLRPWQASMLAPILLGAAHLSRYGDWASTRDLASGSSAHHLVLTMELLDRPVYEYFGGLSRFFDQYMLMFLNWFPREAWPDKPIGLGYASVDEWIGRVGYGDAYTISLGMYGEQLYLMGPYFIISWAAVLLTLIVIRNSVQYLSFGYVAPVVIFEVNLISYIWGGAGALGSRVWFFIIPPLLLIGCWRLMGYRRGAVMMQLRT